MPGSGEIEQTARMIKIASAESMSVAGGGGADRGYIYDAASDDQLELNPGSAKFTGPGFQEQLTGFGRIYAFATAGGEDRAVIVDSAQDDLLVIRPQFTSLRSDNFYVSANGFERVQAYASTGVR